jgi:hypothetical protein
MSNFTEEFIMQTNYHVMDPDGESIRPMTYEEIAHYMFYKHQLIDQEWYETVGGDIS